MQVSETALLLKFVHSLQGGELSPAEVEAWHSVVGRLEYDAAMDAVRAQVTASAERVKPAHVVGRVQRARRDALERRQVAEPGGEIVGKPAWFDSAVAAAEDATRRCIERGYGRGDPITIRSARAAAAEVRQRAEAPAEEVAF